MTQTLNQLRTQIDTVDREILALLNRRAALAHEVGEVKKLDGSAVFRPDREAAVIVGLQGEAAKTEGAYKPEGIAHIWREIMSASRALEAPQRVAYLGPAGTFSEQAAAQFFGASIGMQPCHRPCRISPRLTDTTFRCPLTCTAPT